jgi:hypothetical protein
MPTMQSFDTAKAIAGAPRIVTDPQLKNVLSDRVRDWTALGLLAMTHLVLIEVGDTDVSIIEELAFSPVVNPLDGLRHGMEGFVLPFDLIKDHGGWFELIMTVGNDGFAFVLFVRAREGADPELLAMCRAHVGR